MACLQETVRVAFKNSTILEIAHRLHSVMDADRAIVMSGMGSNFANYKLVHARCTVFTVFHHFCAAGRVVEYDTPYNLLAKNDGVFTQLVESTGPQAASKLRGRHRWLPHYNSGALPWRYCVASLAYWFLSLCSYAGMALKKHREGSQAPALPASEYRTGSPRPQGPAYSGKGKEKMDDLGLGDAAASNDDDVINLNDESRDELN